jgi:hypothetical protein
MVFDRSLEWFGWIIREGFWPSTYMADSVEISVCMDKYRSTAGFRWGNVKMQSNL